MEILSIKRDNEGQIDELEINLTEEEKDKIKEVKGWDELTQERIEEWFIETINNTVENLE